MSDNGGIELMGDNGARMGAGGGGGLLSRAAGAGMAPPDKQGGGLVAAADMQQNMVKPSGQSPKDDYQQWLSQAMMMVHSPETRDDIVEQLRSPDQVKALSDLLVMIVRRLDVASREAGFEVDDQVKIYAAKELLDQIVEVARADKSLNFSLDDEHVELAFSVAIQDYLNGEIEAGRIDKDRLKAKTEQTLRNSSPQQLKEIDGTMNRIAATAQRYKPSGGAQQQGGMISAAQSAAQQPGGQQ